MFLAMPLSILLITPMHEYVYVVYAFSDAIDNALAHALGYAFSNAIGYELGNALDHKFGYRIYKQ